MAINKSKPKLKGPRAFPGTIESSILLPLFVFDDRLDMINILRKAGKKINSENGFQFQVNLLKYFLFV
jgi:hypothetical protein